MKRKKPETLQSQAFSVVEARGVELVKIVLLKWKCPVFRRFVWRR